MEQVLPFAIIIEILSWLPVESCLRCKSVCKQWCALIQDRYFINKHMDRHATCTLHYRKAGNVGTPNTDGTVLEEKFRVFFSLHGLSLEKNIVPQKYHIRNHSTRQTYDLPNPQEDLVAFVFSFVPSIGFYKLVSVYDNKDSLGGCEVLTLGSDEPSWRPLNIPKLHNLKKQRERILVKVVCGVFHLLRIGSDKSELVSLDLENECSTSTTLQRSFFSDWSKVWIVDWNGYLSLSDIAEDNFNVLLLEDYKKPKREKKKIVVPLTFLKENKDMIKKNLVPSAARGDVINFLVPRDKILVYNMKLEKITRTVTAPQGMEMSFWTTSSLVTLKGMRADKNNVK